MYYGPQIVRNGLVLALDAADRNSYPGSDTTWRDLSGNGYNGTLTNSPTFSTVNQGTIVFPGNVDNRVQTSYGPTFTDFTVSLWFKDNNSVQFGRLIDKSYTGGFWLGRNILYGDGVTNTISNTVSSTALDSTTLAIGAWSSGIGSQYFTGNISTVMMYNRVLTATEVLQNYNAQKTRFGL